METILNNPIESDSESYSKSFDLLKLFRVNSVFGILLEIDTLYIDTSLGIIKNKKNIENYINILLEKVYKNLDNTLNFSKTALYILLLEIYTNSYDAIASKGKNSKGKIVLKIYLKEQEGKNYLNIIIKDNGAGKKTANSIVKKNNLNMFGGNGIGLQTIKEFIYTIKLSLKTTNKGSLLFLKYRIK